MLKKQRKSVYGGVALLVMGLALFAISAVASDDDKAAHPDLSEQEMLIACSDCHREATPEVEKQWYDSLHGIAMVKCYQCHGTFETFKVTPSKQDCAICHTDMLEKCPKEKACWECHVPHSFKEKK